MRETGSLGPCTCRDPRLTTPIPSGSVDEYVYSDTPPSEIPADIDSDVGAPTGGDIELSSPEEMVEDVYGAVDMVAGVDVVGLEPLAAAEETAMENEAWRTKRFDEIVGATEVSGEDWYAQCLSSAVKSHCFCGSCWSSRLI